MKKGNVFLLLVFVFIVTFGFFRCCGSYESSNPGLTDNDVYKRLNCDAVSKRRRINMDLQSHIRDLETELSKISDHYDQCPVYLQKQYRRLEHDRALLIYTVKTLEEKDY